MKAYVIKNKEGKYFGVANNYNYEHYWTTLDFAHYFRYLEGHDAKAEAEEYRNTRYSDCEVVEITIAEGDLEQQIRADERRKVCQEIREKADYDDSDPFLGRVFYHISPKLLDKIEKGESK